MSVVSTPIPGDVAAPSTVAPTIPAQAQHAHTASLGTINEATSPTNLAAIADSIDCGAPTTGQYAKNGIWDDDSDSEPEEKEKVFKGPRDSTMSISGTNISTGRKWRQRLSSTAGRVSRQGALSPAPDGSTWPWARKMSFTGSSVNVPSPLASPPLVSPVTAPSISAPLPSPALPATTASSAGTTPEVPSAPVMPSAPTPSPLIASSQTLTADNDVLPEPVIPAKAAPAPSPTMVTTLVLPVSDSGSAGASVIKPSKSRSRLRSMGMSKKPSVPELPKKVEKRIEVFETPLSPVVEPRSPLSPIANVGNNPMRHAQAQVLGSKRPAAVNTKAEKRSGTEDPKPKSAWKRGVERLWRSKSASGLRDSFQRRPTENDPPPMPPLPREHKSGAGAALGNGVGTAGAASTLSLGVTNNLTRSPSTRESVLATPLPQDDVIYSELDKRFPSYPVRAPPNISPLIADEETFEADPFASVIGYASAGRAPSAASRHSRSPIPDFSAILPPMQTNPETGRPMSMKSALLPRLRKSKSMAANSRPASFVGLFTDRKRSVISPKIEQFAKFEPATPTVDEIMRASAGSPTDLEPPKPLFYDMFDIASEDEGASAEETLAAGARKVRDSWSPTALGFERPTSPPTAELSLPPMSAPPFPPSSTTARAAPELLIESASGHSAEIATPAPSSAPAHVTCYSHNELGLDGVFLPLSHPKRDSHNCHPRRESTLVSANTKFDKSSVTGQPESPTFHDLYAQLGIWPEQPEQWLQERHDREVITATPEPPTDDPARDDQSACDPSPLSTPGASWEQAIHSFPPIDDLVLPPSDSIDYPTSYHGPVDYDIAPDDTTANIHMRSQRSMPGGYSNESLGLGPTDSEPHGHSNSSARHRQRDASDSTSHTTASGYSWRDAPPRRSDGGSGSGTSSRGSSRERRRRAAPAEGGWSIESDSSDPENDDVPLSKLHPQAGAAQQQRLADAVRRREARRAERERELRQTKSQMFDRERERLAKRERELQRGASVREPPESRRSRTAAPEWNGEGGVPADMLAGRLERVAVSSSQSRQGGSGSAGVSRAPTINHPGSAGSHPMSRPRVTRTSQEESTSATHSAAMSRTPTIGGNSTHSAHSNTSGGHSNQQQHRELTRGASLSHSSSRATRSSNNTESPATSLGRSATTVSRRRALSNVREPMSPTEAPPVPRRGVPVRGIIMTAGGERPFPLEVFPETTAREVLAKVRDAMHLVDGVSGPTSGWVVSELFAELGLERQIREYEVIANITHGWDAQAKGNALVIRESHHANQTLAKAVSDSAPFVGGWVQLETKRGKWSKRWLETRGGHVFISKNEKGKDELQINTMFSDVYTPSTTYPSPQRHVFAFKRLEPLASFENPTEHVHYISTDDATGWKLSTAAYASRSFTLVAAQKHAQNAHNPHGLNRAPSQQHKSQGDGHLHPSGTVRRGSRQAPPLVELKAGPTRQSTNKRLDLNAQSGFTGKGLLGNI